MGERIATRTCPACRTVSRDRGDAACPRCGAPFPQDERPGAPAEASGTPGGSEAAPQPPAPTPAPPPPNPPASRLEELIAQAAAPPDLTRTTGELDPLGVPYDEPASVPAAREQHADPPAEPFASPAAGGAGEDPFDHASAPPPSGDFRAVGTHSPHDVDESRLVRADLARHHDTELPWYLRRSTLIALGVIAVFLLAVVAWQW